MIQICILFNYSALCVSFTRLSVASILLFALSHNCRDIDEKFNKSEMSGNLQNTAARDKLIFEVHTYFKDTLCDLSEKDDSVEQENLVKAFIVSFQKAVTAYQMTCWNINVFWMYIHRCHTDTTICYNPIVM